MVGEIWEFLIELAEFSFEHWRLFVVIVVASYAMSTFAQYLALM